jgi:GAF domain
VIRWMGVPRSMPSLGELTVAFENATLAGGLAGADQLCVACVALLDVDGAAISLLHEGVTRGTFGSSGELSRRLDALQFTFGEGPCLDAVSRSRPVLVADLADADSDRWPAFTGALLQQGVRAVFALPVAVAGVCVGALDLFRYQAGPLTSQDLDGALLAAEVAELPLLQLMSGAIGWTEGGDGTGPVELATLARVEVYQATGMIMGRLDVGPEEALLRLRGYAFSHDMTASEVAWSIVERRLVLADDDTEQPSDGATGGNL